jgi:hypothetical protein
MSMLILFSVFFFGLVLGAIGTGLLAISSWEQHSEEQLREWGVE